MAYKIKNVSRILIYEGLDTEGADGKPEVLTLRKREQKTISDAQWGSRSVQKLIKRGLIRSQSV